MARRNGTPNPALRQARANGDKFYQPDFLCNNGHMTKRFTGSGACYECCKAHGVAFVKKVRVGPDGDAYRLKKNAELREWKRRPENLERIREYQRKEQARHRKKHPINGRVDMSNRRAKKLGIEGRITVQEIKDLLEKQDNKCASCDEALKPNWNIDHRMPLRLRGLNKIENIQILCRFCNRSKGSIHPDHWDIIRRGGTL